MAPHLQNYLSDPAGFFGSGRSFFTGNAAAAALKLLSLPARFYPLKKRCTRRFAEALTADELVSPFSLLFSKEKEIRAFMDDCGSLTLSRGSLLRLSAPAYLAVVLHEIAHLVLRDGADYSQLKELDRAFRDSFRERLGPDRSVRLSPIEFGADALAMSMIGELVGLCPKAKQRQRLQKELQSRTGDLEARANEIRSLGAE